MQIHSPWPMRRRLCGLPGDVLQRVFFFVPAKEKADTDVTTPPVEPSEPTAAPSSWARRRRPREHSTPFLNNREAALGVAVSVVSRFSRSSRCS